MIALLHMICALSLLAAVPVAADTSRSISGHWYTEGIEHDIYYQLVFDRRDDGTFTVEGREVLGCKPGPSGVESGTWSYGDGVLLNWTLVVGGRAVPDNEYYHDKFLVIVSDDDHHTSFDTKTKVTWTMTRVSPGFRFPTPAPCATSRLPQ